MKISSFPHCCGAVILSNFLEREGGLYLDASAYMANSCTYDAFMGRIQQYMNAARDPYRKGRMEGWNFGPISVLYAITNNYMPLTVKILGELGWERVGEPVKNVNSGNLIQLWEYRTKFEK